MGFGMFGGLLIFGLVLLVLAVVLVPGLFSSNKGSTTNESPSARQILEQRYARGEINREQYVLMLKDIQ